MRKQEPLAEVLAIRRRAATAVRPGSKAALARWRSRVTPPAFCDLACPPANTSAC